MELQELSCKALIANVRFPLSPLMVDNRGELIQRLEAALGTTEFAWGDSHVEVSSTDRHDHFRLTGRDLLASCEHFADREATIEKIKTFVIESIRALDVREVAFVGVRTFWIAATDDFADLRDHLLDRRGTTAAALADLAGKRPTDVAWVFEFHERDPRITVRMGPMKTEQATQQIFRVEDTALYPPEFLFLDVDRVLSDDTRPADDLLDRLSRNFDQNLDLAGRFGRYFTTLGS